MRSVSRSSFCCTFTLLFYNLVTLYACLLIFRKHSPDIDVQPVAESVVPHGFGLTLRTDHYQRLRRATPSRRIISGHDEQYWNQWKPSVFTDHAAPSNVPQDVTVIRSAARTVEIWSKTGHGLYLWEHVLDGQLTSHLNGVWFYGEKTLGSTKFKFRSGRGIMPDKVPVAAENVLLILNGRSAANIAAARMWLDELPSFQRLHNAALLLLGDEQCANDWVLSYLKNGTAAATTSAIKLVFLVYDSPIIDNLLIRQWPLGVATYRGFPKRGFSDIIVPGNRKYVCNFLGTVYKGSTRETLVNVIKDYVANGTCFLKARTEWSPDETALSLAEYIDILRQSDVTLCPVGLNAETYRIYEAMSMGSMPIIEDVTTPGNCRTHAARGGGGGGGGNSQLGGPHGLLKSLNAPVLFIRDWHDLSEVMTRELRLSAEEKLARRQRLVEWYATFMAELRRTFVSAINLAFFNDTMKSGDDVVAP